jgi:hypothetical protein
MIESKLGPGTERQKFEQDMFSRSDINPDYLKSNTHAPLAPVTTKYCVSGSSKKMEN